jgi:hypothetical protein
LPIAGASRNASHDDAAQRQVRGHASSLRAAPWFSFRREYLEPQASDIAKKRRGANWFVRVEPIAAVSALLQIGFNMVGSLGPTQGSERGRGSSLRVSRALRGCRCQYEGGSTWDARCPLVYLTKLFSNIKMSAIYSKGDPFSEQTPKVLTQ